MTDLSTLDTISACDQGAEIEIRHPATNAATGIFITVLGKDSSVFKAFSRAKTNARLNRDAMNARRGKDSASRTVEDIEQENLELLAACTVTWRTVVAGKGGAVESKPVIFLKGEELSCTPENSIRVYRDFPTIYSQLDEAIGEMENFIKA